MRRCHRAERETERSDDETACARGRIVDAGCRAALLVRRGVEHGRRQGAIVMVMPILTTVSPGRTPLQ